MKDKRVLKLIRRFLQAGVMLGGVVVRTEEGSPQGGPLSPLLANIYLEDLDKELEKRGHKFVRYVDDCNPSGPGGHSFVFGVSDTGPGFAPEELARLGHRFVPGNRPG